MVSHSSMAASVRLTLHLCAGCRRVPMATTRGLHTARVTWAGSPADMTSGESPAMTSSDESHSVIIRKARAAGETRKTFVDFVRVKVFGGAGGDGAVTFTSYFAREYSGPDGGDGGNGGHVIFRATRGQRDLGHVPALIYAKAGKQGLSVNRTGANAEHTEIAVPLGTVVKVADTGRLAAELTTEGARYLAARGGAGGHGNQYFLTNEQRAPTSYELGGEGEARGLTLELRTMADAGLVGFPNAGKSSLLRAISRARPRVAAYPFTTLNPHVGMVEYADTQQLAVADIPGLVEGAHLNRGLGFSFLRHIERCVCLLYVLDLGLDQPRSQLEALRTELDLYEAGLSRRPSAVVANKLDLPGAAARLQRLREELTLPVYGVSAKTGLNIPELQAALRDLHDKHTVTSS